MRRSSILITCFIIFLFAFLGYSLWNSNVLSKFTPIYSEVSSEKKMSDIQMAEKYLHNVEPERSLSIIRQHQAEMEQGTAEGKRWLNLFVQASSDLNDNDQLLLIFQFNPESFTNNEQASLKLADALIKNGHHTEYQYLRNLWKNRETHGAPWLLLDADSLIYHGKHDQAYRLLKDKKWAGKLEEERQMRIVHLRLHENPQESLTILNDLFSKNPRSTEIRILRGKLFESQQKTALAEQEFQAAVLQEPYSPYLQDELAEFYRRQKNYQKALFTWQKQLEKSPNDQILVKSVFWDRVSTPHMDWKKNSFTYESPHPLLTYMKGLKTDQFWDQKCFESLPGYLDLMQEHQSCYWLHLLQTLKSHDEQAALTLLNNNHFQNISWSPMLELALRRVLNYRKHSSLLLDEDKNGIDPLLAEWMHLSHLLPFYKELDHLAHQEATQGASFTMPTEMHTLLCNQEIFPILLISEGWNEAALQLYPVTILSADFPECAPTLYIQALRQNRGNEAAIKFIHLQKQTPILALLEAEINIAEGKNNQAIPVLNKLKDQPDNVGAKATWLLSLIDMQNHQYRQAGHAIESHPILSQTLYGKEALGRIAVMEGEPEVAAAIYEKIVDQSSEAKSFLARRAYQQQNWMRAKELTESLLDEFPGNVQLQENLKKINMKAKS